MNGPKPTAATEPIAQHPAVFGFGTAQPARSRKPLAPSFWGEGRRGGERAETEGTPPNEGTEGIAQVAKAGVYGRSRRSIARRVRMPPL